MHKQSYGNCRSARIGFNVITIQQFVFFKNKLNKLD